MPLRYRHDYAADLHRGLPADDLKPAQEFPARDEGRVRTAIQPLSTGCRAGGKLKGRDSAGSSRPPSRLACRTRAIR